MESRQALLAYLRLAHNRLGLRDNLQVRAIQSGIPLIFNGLGKIFTPSRKVAKTGERNVVAVDKLISWD